MDTSKIIDALGGNKAVMESTGLSKGRISQWRNGERVPLPWLHFFLTRLPQYSDEIQAEIDAEISRKASESEARKEAAA